MKRSLKRNIVTALNALIILMTVVSVIWGINAGVSGFNRIGFFVPFTNLSNMFMGLCAAVFLIKNLLKKDITKADTMLYLSGASAVALTLATVLFFLVPMKVIQGEGFWVMYKGYLLFFHLLSPLLAIISFVIAGEFRKINYKGAVIGILPAVLYSVYYCIRVLVIKDMPDFYGFLISDAKGYWIAALLIMYSAAYLCSAVLVFIRNICQRNKCDATRR